jgi:hypothetical protein
LYFLAGAEQIKSYEERQVFLEDMGLTETWSFGFNTCSLQMLKQQTYFTAVSKRLELGPSM